MNSITEVKQEQFDLLRVVCEDNDIPMEIMMRLLEAEKVKKLLRRRALIQETIELEIDKAINYEN